MSIDAKHKISSESIRRTLKNMKEKGIDFENSNFNGTITIRTNINGKIYEKEYTDEEINEAYRRSLEKYGAL